MYGFHCTIMHTLVSHDLLCCRLGEKKYTGSIFLSASNILLAHALSQRFHVCPEESVLLTLDQMDFWFYTTCWKHKYMHLYYC